MSLSTPRTTSYRQTEIIALLRKSGRVAVEELAAHFGVTLQTIRRDLNELSEARRVVRVHGGAIVAWGSRTWPTKRVNRWPSRRNG